jgi:hypothetical protein
MSKCTPEPWVKLAEDCINPSNDSGVYVQATEYDTLVEQNKALREALDRVWTWYLHTDDGEMSQSLEKEVEQLLTQTGDNND